MRKREILRGERIRLMSHPKAIPRTGPIEEQFTARYVPVTESGCWLWIGDVRDHGYGTMGYQGVRDYAHRISYRLFKGIIPEDFDIDHLCRVRCCVNPEHLEAVTHRENCLRGVSPAAVAYKKMYCVNGHELFGDNVLIMASRPRKRVCRACSRERMRRRKQRAML